MALTTITVHGEILDPDGLTPAVGSVTFRSLVELRDTVDNITYEPATWVETLDINGEFTVVLPTTDNPDITPLNWTYQVYVSTTAWRETFYIELPVALGPVAEFADLIPLDDPTTCTPDGTACAPISLVGEVAALQADLNNIDASQITTGTLSYLRLGGDIPEPGTVAFNRPTLVDPPTAADVWQFRYNGVRVTYANEFACLRVRGIPDNQVPARFMSHATRDETAHPTFQVSLSDAATHKFQVLADGQILNETGLDMNPTAPVVVGFTAPAGDAATISDGVGSGAPYPVTTVLFPAFNRVYLNGAVANNGGAPIAGGTVLFTVTAAHRPAAWVQFNERTSTTLSARVTVRPDGTVRLDQALAVGATVSFDGLNWAKA